jgi:predicted RNA-binding Zn-ribbon protein involved in translation (DUF1610 family)
MDFDWNHEIGNWNMWPVDEPVLESCEPEINKTNKGCKRTRRKVVVDDKRPWICVYSGCKYRTTKQHLLQRHISRHKVPLLCPSCGDVVESEVQLWRHKSLHSGVNMFGCSECGYLAYNIEGVQSHQKHAH